MEEFRNKLKQSGFGLIAIAAGASILIMVHTDPSGANAPLWVVDAAASIFLFAGLSIVATGFGFPLLGRLCGLACAYLLAAPALWMLFDGQGASCSASVAIAGLSATSGAASGLCRAAFGIGGLLTLGFALLMTWLTFRRRTAPPVRTPGA